MTFMRIRKARVPSSAATSKTVRDRVEALEGIRNTVSGCDSAVQLSSEVTAQSTEHREKLLDELFKMPYCPGSTSRVTGSKK